MKNEHNPFDLSSPLPTGYKLTNASTHMNNDTKKEIMEKRFDEKFPHKIRTLIPNEIGEKYALDVTVEVKNFIRSELLSQLQELEEKIERYQWTPTTEFGGVKDNVVKIKIVRDIISSLREKI